MNRKREAIFMGLGVLTGLALSGPAAQAATGITARPSTQPIYVDGQRIGMTAYNIGGNNYVKLRDIGKAVNFGVTYNASTNSVYIDSTQPYQEEVPATPSGPTEESVQAALQALRRQYPHGTLWCVFQPHTYSRTVSLLDDFAAAADSCIPDFDKITSVIRSREISVSVILQSLSQLEASYGHARAMTIINNCDHLLYLGGQDVETARYISTKANKSINTVLNMPLDAAWLFTRGQEPKQVQKYDLSQHPRYHGLSHEREIAVSGKEHEPDWLPRLGE